VTEKEWVQLIAVRISASCLSHSSALNVRVDTRLPYGYEIIEYHETPVGKSVAFATDLLITESTENGSRWKPRVVLESKINSINTHDSITYSQKAALHKSVHPYLRYGVVLGNRREYPLPGRLYRHGAFFDFMISFVSFEPTEAEMVRFTNLIHEEIEASRKLEKIIYESRKKDRKRYTLLHRKLHLE
jgi:hypothetical protein